MRGKTSALLISLFLATVFASSNLTKENANIPNLVNHFLAHPEISTCTPIIIYDSKQYNDVYFEVLKSKRLQNRPLNIYDIRGALEEITPIVNRNTCQVYLHLTELCSPEALQVIENLFLLKLFNSLSTYFHLFWMDKYTPSRSCENDVLKFLPASLYLKWDSKNAIAQVLEYTTNGFWNHIAYYSSHQGFYQLYTKLFEVNDCSKTIVAAFLSMDQPIDPDNYTGNFANAQIWPTTAFLSRYADLNFKYVERVDNVYGLPTKNGSFTGMVGMLERGEIDFVFGPMGYNRFRDGVADYTGYHFTTSSVFYRIKSGFLPKWQALMWPFDNISWIIVIGLIFLTGYTYVLIVYMTTRKTKVSDCLLNTISIFLGEGYRVQVGVVSEYILLISWIGYSLIILTGYGGLLKSCLVSLERQTSVEDLEGIYQSNSHSRIGLWIGGFMHGFYKSSASPALKGIILEKNLVHIETAAEGFSAVHEGKLDILFQNDKDTMLIIDRYKSLYQSQSFDYHYRRFIVRNNSRFMGYINNGLQRYLASGLSHYEREMVRNGLQNIQEKRNPDLYSYKTEVDQLKPLSVNDLQGGFWLLIVGYLVATVCCALEKLYFWAQTKNVLFEFQK